MREQLLKEKEEIENKKKSYEKLLNLNKNNKNIVILFNFLI
jgi:hypothetical protein